MVDCGIVTSWVPSFLGLIGTGLLAYSSLKAIPIARLAYAVTLQLAQLDKEVNQRLAQENAPDQDKGTHERAAAAEATTREVLQQRQGELNTAQTKWTASDTRRAIAGVVLTLLSYFMPLFAPLCTKPAVASKTCADDRHVKDSTGRFGDSASAQGSRAPSAVPSNRTLARRAS